MAHELQRGESQPNLPNGELQLLIDGLTDVVSFDMALLHLGLRGNPPDRSEPPNTAQIEVAFRRFEGLLTGGLIQLGRMQYVDGGPPGRVAPVEHIEERFQDVRSRVKEACRTAEDWGDWAFSCWTANTADGDALARELLSRELPDE